LLYVRRRFISKDHTEMFRLHRDGRVWLVYLRITDDQYLEIFPEAVQDRSPGPETNGINHFCVIVENIENIVRQLADKGITLYLPLKTGADNNRQAWIGTRTATASS
jgi:lactoylglutathione lyase